MLQKIAPNETLLGILNLKNYRLTAYATEEGHRLTAYATEDWKN